MTTAGTGTSDHAMAAIASARRASAAERASTVDLTIELCPLTAIGSVVEPWKRLAARALEPNVFYDPAFALAAQSALGRGVTAGLVWSLSPHELLGFFPVYVDSHRYGLPLPVLCGWTHPFAPLGTPLVHREFAEPVIAAWLDHVARDPALPGLMLMPFLGETGAFATVLDAVVDRRDMVSAAFDRHERALLAPGADRTGYIAWAVAAKKRKEFARQWRRLEDHGTVTVERDDGPHRVAAALEDFLVIEASGWKGRAGTAAANDDGIRRFLTRAVMDLAAEQRASVYRLISGERAIAAAITLRSGSTAWCWKIAYDENYARYSPGAQLLLRVTEDLLHEPGIEYADSCATAHHPLIDHIWRERLSVADRLIAVKPDRLLPFTLACRLEEMRRLGLSAARAVRDHLRRR